MGLGAGNIVSIGGGTGGTGGSTSGILVIDPGGNTGTTVVFDGVNGISVTSPSTNLILIDGAGASGVGGSDGSGINDINGALGPSITLDGANGANVLTNGNTLTVDVSALSGLVPTKFAASFVDISSGLFTHNLGTEDVIVQVRDDRVPPRVIQPDDIIIENTNQVSILFNRSQTGRAVII